jgi:hypothetical protein
MITVYYNGTTDAEQERMHGNQIQPSGQLREIGRFLVLSNDRHTLSF